VLITKERQQEKLVSVGPRAGTSAQLQQ
jgi:hypothetical protein